MRKKIKTRSFKTFQTHGFCGMASMFLTTPTVEELKQSDLPELVDMLWKQTLEHSRLLKSEGVTFKTVAIKELIVNIQAAIAAKKSAKKSGILS